MGALWIPGSEYQAASIDTPNPERPLLLQNMKKIITNYYEGIRTVNPMPQNVFGR
jgi:hypothetical protein